MSHGLFALICAGLAGFGVLLAVTGWVVALISQAGKPGGFNMRGGERPVGFAFTCIMSAAIIIAVAIIGLLLDGLWWLLPKIFVHISPGSLALISITVGVVPLILTGMAGVAAKVMGGRVDARGAEGCRLLGKNMNGVVEALFMSHVLAIFTSGLALLGLLASGIWALLI